MTITIPAWLLWVLGIAAGLVILFFAVFGFLFLRSYGRSGGFRM